MRGKTAIVADDGIATGATIKVALRATRRAGPKRLVLAVPVAPSDTIAELGREADAVHCLDAPEELYATGLFYVNFHRLADGEVIALLEEARTFLKDQPLPTQQD